MSRLLVAGLAMALAAGPALAGETPASKPSPVKRVGAAAGGLIGNTAGSSLGGPLGGAAGGLVGKAAGRGVGGLLHRVFGRKGEQHILVVTPPLRAGRSVPLIEAPEQVVEAPASDAPPDGVREPD